MFPRINGLVKWFSDKVLGPLGVINRKATILFLGLDNAGKTTLLRMLRDGTMTTNSPTGLPYSEEVKIGNLTIKTFDVGGHETARRVWNNYYEVVDAFVFIVDAADNSRFMEAAEELERVLNETASTSIPVAILGNKIDMNEAASGAELRSKLGVAGQFDQKLSIGSGNRPVDVFMCSVLWREGYCEAFEWLSKIL